MTTPANEPKRLPPTLQTQTPRLKINFNRKILDYGTLQALKDTLDGQGQVRGSAISGVVDDLMKLRYLCDEIVKHYREGNTNKALQGLEMLELVI